MTLFRVLPSASEAPTHTWRIAAPAETHRRPADCREVDCIHYQHGWVTEVATDSPQARYIREEMNRGEDASRRRTFTEERPYEGMSRFVFPPGQRCFRQHTAPTGREGLYLMQPSGGHPPIPFRRREVWRDDMNEELHQLKALVDREGQP